MRYRPEIDGLRAIAILAVVLFHSGFTLFSGGFVGVDVFFVLSGYLISSILLFEMDSATFRFRHFWMRRLRRLYPAMLFMLLGAVILFGIFSIPVTYESFAHTLIAQLFFVSNFHFWLQSGYFTPDAKTLPLLHTWSLSVEEQFYLIFPILLLLVSKRIEWRKPILISIGILSFLLSVALARYGPIIAFYLLPARIWEFGLGVGLTFLSRTDYWSKKWKADPYLPSLGLVAILIAVFKYSELTPFPSFRALLPCLGTVAIIFGTRDGQGWVTRFLSLPPMRFIGLISYSLYLWSWFFVVLSHTISISKPTWIENLGWIAASVAAATVSYFFIENPIRKKREIFTDQRLAWGCGLTSLLLLSSATVIIRTDGFKFRFNDTQNYILSFIGYDHRKIVYRSDVCFLSEKTQTSFTAFKPECMGPKPGRKSILVWGDSYGAHLYHGLKHRFKDADVFQLTSGNCEIIGVDHANDRCASMHQEVLDHIIQHHYDIIILGGFWESRFKSKSMEGELLETLDQLHRAHANVYVMGPLPRWDFDLPNLIFRHYSLKHEYPVTVPTTYWKDLLAIQEKIKMITAGRARFIPALDQLCKDGNCRAMATADVPMAWDVGHLTADGSIVVSDIIFNHLSGTPR